MSECLHVRVFSGSELIGTVELDVDRPDGATTGGSAQGVLKPTAAYAPVREQLLAANARAARAARQALPLKAAALPGHAEADGADPDRGGMTFRTYPTAAEALENIPVEDRPLIHAALDFHRIHRELQVTLVDGSGTKVGGWVQLSQAEGSTAPRVMVWLDLEAPDFSPFFAALEPPPDA
jgi:hypothetical protein